jgi:hypothetical protein
VPSAIRRSDIRIAAASLVLSFLLVDLFFGLVVLAALVIGAFGLFRARRQHESGRVLVDVSVGALLAAVALVVLAAIERA